MSMNSILDSKEMRGEVKKAMVEMAHLVGSTLGPGGRPILISHEGGVFFTKDGVTCADHYEGRGGIGKVVASAAKEVCERTARVAGDGTTTAIVLAAALVDSGQEWLGNNTDASPQRLAREMRDFYENVIKKDVLSFARPIRGLPAEEASVAIRHVALVSANHDVEIADAVVEAVEYVGEDGMIIAEEGAGNKTSVQHKDGFPVNSGLSELGPAAGVAFTNRSSGMELLLEGSYVALYDGDVSDCNALLPILQAVATEQVNGRLAMHPIVIVAHSFDDQVLKFLSQNFRKPGGLKCVPFVTPRNGQAYYKQQFLHDLSSYVGGTVFDPQVCHIKDASLGQLGFTEEFRMSQRDAAFITTPNTDRVNARISRLKEIAAGSSEFDGDRIRYRIGQLTGGVATIYAGGTTALEAKERHARLVDAISSVRSAMDMGVVPGGGATLAHLSMKYKDLSGVASILAKAIVQPFLCILMNSGVKLVNVGDQISAVGPSSEGFMVYDALEGRRVEWYSGGIMDPAKVTLTALDNAISVAQLMITLGGILVPDYTPEERQVKTMQEGLLKAINQGEFE